MDIPNIRWHEDHTGEQVISASADDLEKKVQALSSKYANTLTDIENEIHSAEAELCKMLDDLVGNEFDMAGLACLKKLLGGE